MLRASNMTADIFIPTSNRLDSLKNCLKSLNAQSHKNFRIIIVGINRDKQVITLINSFKRLNILYIIQKEKGLINAANLALKRANKDIFIRIDDDVAVDRDWLKNIIKTFESSDKIGGVTGPTVMTNQGVKSRDLTAFLSVFKKSKNPLLKLLFSIYFDFLYEKKLYKPSLFLSSGVFTLGSNFKAATQLKKNIEINNLEACNFSIRTKLLKKVGGFDGIYLKGLGDYHESDAALKVKDLGYKLMFDPKAKVQHLVEFGKVSKARPAPYYRIQNFIIFYFRFFPIKSATQVIKFATNLCFQNAYYIYRFATTGQSNQLSAMPGTIVGLISVIFSKHQYKHG